MSGFKAGDKARLNNQQEVLITSWPAELPGWFAYKYSDNKGSEVTGVEFYGGPDYTGQSAVLEKTEDGGEVKSTLPPLNDDIISGHEPTAAGPAELTEPADPLRDEGVGGEPEAESEDEIHDEPLAEDSGYPGVPSKIG